MNITDITNFFNLVFWREPLWMLLVFTPLLSLWFRRALHPKGAHFADAHLMPWIVSHQHIGIWQRLFSKNNSFLAAWLLFGIAASGPRLALELVTPEQPTNMDIMLVVDVSRSMQVTDISPSRLRRAQIEIEELLQRAAGKRIGVIVFAGRAHLLVPLTSDHNALRFYLKSLDTLVLPTQGSEPSSALKMAHKELANSKNPSAIIMFTDGDFSKMPGPEITALNQANIPLYLLGIGSAEGEAISLKNNEWLQHEGRPVISRLNEDNLRKMANISRQHSADHSHYSAALDDDSDWQQLYDNGINNFSADPTDANNNHNVIWRELYHWPLFLALILWWLSIMPYALRLQTSLAAHTPIRTLLSKIAIISRSKTLPLALVFLLLNLYTQQDLSAANTGDFDTDVIASESQAFKNYSMGNYPAALAIYKQLSGYSARLGEGASHYRLEDYNNALRQYTQAVLAANTDKERAVSLFNLGNSYFQMGNYADALTVYQDAIQYQPGQQDILHNLQFTRALKKAVDDRLRKTPNAARMGSGPRRTAAENVSEINQRGFIALAENENLEPKNLPLPELADISNATLEALIQKGLSQIALAATNNHPLKHNKLKHSKMDFINAHLRMMELEDQQALLWKQLFEIEEGFPAPLAEPREIPGVTPW